MSHFRAIIFSRNINYGNVKIIQANGKVIQANLLNSRFIIFIITILFYNLKRHTNENINNNRIHSCQNSHN